MERLSEELYVLNRTGEARYAPLYVHRFSPAQQEPYENCHSAAQRLRWLRRSRGLRQKDVASIAGVSRWVYGDLEAGKAKCLPAGMADRLAQYYGVPATDLMDEYTRFLQSNPAARLRNHRTALGLSREAYAQTLGTDVRRLELWETGKRTISYKSWKRFFAEDA